MVYAVIISLNIHIIIMVILIARQRELNKRIEDQSEHINKLENEINIQRANTIAMQHNFSSCKREIQDNIYEIQRTLKHHDGKIGMIKCMSCGGLVSGNHICGECCIVDSANRS